MKKKLTLLIALSIAIIMIVGLMFIPTSSDKKQVTEEPAVSSIPSAIVSSTPSEEVSSEEVSSVTSKSTPVKKEETTTTKPKPTSKPETETKPKEESKVEEKPKEEVKEEKPKEEPKEEVSLPSGKYPEATLIWNRLKAAGLNDYVCAGILGNIMSEVGGHTLDFSRWKYWSQGSHYGICQWGGSRRKNLLNNFGSDLESQVDFILYEMKSEFNAYGYKYKSGFKYNDFLNLTDERQAALAFAKCYERCAGGYSGRQNQATTAYNYFVK